VTGTTNGVCFFFLGSCALDVCYVAGRGGRRRRRKRKEEDEEEYVCICIYMAKRNVINVIY